MIEIPGYTILRPLGQGGMATVYLAVQQSLGREVALKVLSPALAQDATATERFLREARIAAKLHHPHIVAIHDVGVHAGTPYMSIAYEPGGTVAQLAQTHLDPKAVFRIIRDIAGALDYAHRQGVAHRDVKPENILLRTDGTCVLSDFGIARAAESQIGLTREGTSVGTPHYMSPEQMRGEHTDGRSDLYSLGVVFYQLLVGELPYKGTDAFAIGMQHLMEPIPRLPSSLIYLQDLLDALLAKDPAARLQTGAEVVRWIDANITLTPAMTVAMMTPRGLPASGSTATVASIAVLPFADMSQAKDQEYFADGLSEEVLNLLAKVPNLHVAGRTSSFSFKNKHATLAEIGRELKVATVLEGSVRKLGERIRVSVQLLKVTDGFHLWSETYDRQLTDVFAVQDEIAVAVVEALKAKLLPAAAPSAAMPVDVVKPVITPVPVNERPIEVAIIPEPAVEPKSQSFIEPVVASEFVPEPIPAPTPVPIPEPIPELTLEPIPEPASESTPELTLEPIPEPAPQAAHEAEPKPEPVIVKPDVVEPIRAPEVIRPPVPAEDKASNRTLIRQPVIKPPQANDVPATARVSDFASAFEARANTPAKPSPKPDKNRVLPAALIGLVILGGIVGLAYWKFGGDPVIDAQQQCKTLLADSQTALTAGDFDKAAVGANAAKAHCANDQLVVLQALEVLIQNGQDKAQTCLQAETQATALLASGQPAQARDALEPVRESCGDRSQFVSLSQQPNKAMAEANDKINQARIQLQANAFDAADGLIESALKLDAKVPDAETLQKESQKQRAKLARTNDQEKAFTVIAAAPSKPVDKVIALPPPAPRRPEPTKPAKPAPTPQISRPVADNTQSSTPVQPEPAPAAVAPGPPRLVPINTPAPDYPASALRSSTTGHVIASFTVNADGSVGNIKILGSKPRGVFERSVQTTLRTWRFQPTGESQSVTRTFKFSP